MSKVMFSTKASGRQTKLEVPSAVSTAPGGRAVAVLSSDAGFAFEATPMARLDSGEKAGAPIPQKPDPKVSVADKGEAPPTTEDLNLRRQQADVAIRELELERLRRTVEKETASPTLQRIYNFEGPVNDQSVSSAITWLTEQAAISKDPITLRLHTGGGSVFAGLALFDTIRQIRQEGIKINTVSNGWAASMGSVLLQAGEVRAMGKNSILMIHEPSSGMSGTLSQMENSVEMTQLLWDRLAEITSERSTMSKEKFLEWVNRKDQWLTAEQALKLGFIDEIH